MPKVKNLAEVGFSILVDGHEDENVGTIDMAGMVKLADFDPDDFILVLMKDRLIGQHEAEMTEGFDKFFFGGIAFDVHSLPPSSMDRRKAAAR